MTSEITSAAGPSPSVEAHVQPRGLRITLLALCLAGLVVSFLLWMMQADARGALSSALCSIGQRMACVDVLGSRYAKFVGVPWALWGCLYFSFLTLWYWLIGLPNHAGRAWHVLPFASNVVSMAGSAWMVYVMAARLPTWCPWCLLAHGVNLALFVAAWRGFPRGPEPAGQTPWPRRGRVFGVVGASAAIAVLFFLAAFAFIQFAAASAWRARYMEAANTADYLIWRHARATLVDLPVRPDDPARGAAEAPHVVVVFSDLECPHCRMFDRFAARLVERAPGRVRVVFKHYPLCAACNSAVAEQTARRAGPACPHPFACDAAMAVEAVRQLGGPAAAARYISQLFEHADALAERPYERLVLQVGLEPAEWRAAMDDPALARRVADDVALAKQLGVSGAGVVFLDGRRMHDWRLSDAREPNRTDEQATFDLWDRLLGSD